MRKLLLAAVAVFSLAVTNSFAQPVHRFGVKLGVAVSDQQFNYTSFSSGFDQIVGTNMAVSVEWLSSRHFNILTEFHFVQKGMTERQIATGESGPDPVGELTFKNRVNYFSVPILAKLSLLSNRVFSPYLVAGPRVDFKLGYESTFFGDVYKDFKRVTYGASVGLGTELKVSNNFSSLLEVRFSPDFANAYASDLLTVRNQALEFLFGVKF